MKWEYQSILIEATDLFSKENLLQEAGNLGWELVAVIPYSNAVSGDTVAGRSFKANLQPISCILLLKRPMKKWRI